MRSPRMAPNTFVAPAGKLVQIRPPRALFRFCWLAVDGLMAPARNAVDSETQKEIVLQVGPKNRYFPLSSKAAGATFIIVAVQESTRSGETRGPRERSAPRATVYKTIRRGLRRQEHRCEPRRRTCILSNR